jgi:hypothetical protein
MLSTINIGGTTYALSGHSDVAGGGGGTTVAANPGSSGGGVLSTINIGGTTYALSGHSDVAGGGGGTTVSANPGSSGGGMLSTINIGGTTYALSGHSDVAGGGGGGSTETASNIGIGSGLISGKDGTDIKVKSITGAGFVDISDYGDEQTLLISGTDQYTTGAVEFGTGDTLFHVSDTGIWFSLMPTVSGVPLSTGGGGTTVAANPGSSGGGVLSTINIGGTTYAISGHSDAAGGGGGGGGTLSSGTTIGHSPHSTNASPLLTPKSGAITFVSTGATGSDGLLSQDFAPIEFMDGGTNVIAISGIETGRFLDEPKFNALFDFYPRNNPSGFVRHTNFVGASGITVIYDPMDDSLDGNKAYTVTIGAASGVDSVNGLKGAVSLVGSGRSTISTVGSTGISIGLTGPESINSISDGAITVEGLEQINVITSGSTIKISGTAVQRISTDLEEGIVGEIRITGNGGNIVTTSGQNILVSGITISDVTDSLGDEFVKTTTNQTIQGNKIFEDSGIFEQKQEFTSGIRFAQVATGATGELGTIQSSGGYGETGHWEIVNDLSDNSVAINWITEDFEAYT